MGTRGVRGLSGALTVVVALMAALLVGVPQAQAALHNPIPMNQDEEPTYDFVDDDALFIYVTSDIAGGRACIVEASVATPGAGSCDAPAWGSPNAIVGIGSIITPLEGPSLMPGSWRLLVEDSSFTPTAVSEVFTVTACADCSREFAQAAIDEWKARADDIRTGLNLTCVAFAVKDLTGQVTAARGKIKKATDRADAYQAGDAGFAATVLPSVGGLLGFGFPSFDPIGTSNAKALEILHDLSCAAGAMYNDIVNDPPDPDYDTVATPTFAVIGDSPDDSLDALMSQMDAQAAFAEVALTSFERYLGAVDDGDDAAARAQAQAASDHSVDQVARMRATAEALRDYAAVLAADDDFTGPTASAESWTKIKAAYDRIREDGFAPDEVSDLQDLGLTAGQIGDVRTHFEVPVDGFDPSESLPARLEALADETEQAAVGIDAFAREAGAVAARIASDVGNEAPTALFDLSPTSGAAPLEVTVDASASTDPDGTIASYDWDFGDGGEASTVYAPHTYEVSGTHTITLTVTDDDGATGTATHDVVVSGVPGNHVPVAAFQPDRWAQVGPSTFGFDASASTDPDGTVAAYSWDFGDGSPPATGKKPTHHYGAANGYTVTLTVTDDDGATRTVSHVVHVVDPGSLTVPVCGDEDAGSVVERCAGYAYDPTDTWQVGASGVITFDYVYRAAILAYQLSAYPVDDLQGTVAGIAPGQAGYAAAAYADAVEIFPSGSDAFVPDKAVHYPPGTRLAFYISGQPNDVLRSDPTAGPTYFAAAAANDDKQPHTRSYSGAGLPSQFTFEDLPISENSGADWDDVVFVGTGLRVPELDSDGDTLTDQAELAIHHTDPDDADTDNDGLRDDAEVRSTGCVTKALVPDTDKDGLLDGAEVKGIPFGKKVRYSKTSAATIKIVTTMPCRVDTDLDGIADRVEIVGTKVKQVIRHKDGRFVLRRIFSDPRTKDTDRDGLTDKQELTGSKNRRFDKHKTDPLDWDTDGGGASDGREVQVRTDPSDVKSHLRAAV